MLSSMPWTTSLKSMLVIAVAASIKLDNHLCICMCLLSWMGLWMVLWMGLALMAWATTMKMQSYRRACWTQDLGRVWGTGIQEIECQSQWQVQSLEEACCCCKCNSVQPEGIPQGIKQKDCEEQKWVEAFCWSLWLPSLPWKYCWLQHLLVSTVQWAALQQQRGMEKFHGKTWIAEKEQEMPTEKEVKAILSRGMQQPKVAVLGAWGLQLPLSWKKSFELFKVCSATMQAID